MGPALPGAQRGSALGGGLQRPHTSSKALSAESRTPGRGFRGRPSFRQLSTGGGMAWLRHSRATDSLAVTDTFSSSPRMLGGTAEGTGEERVGTAARGQAQPRPAARTNAGARGAAGWVTPRPELQLSDSPLHDLRRPASNRDPRT